VTPTGEHLSPAEQHLGDRLAAFVDGELHDDARDRVLAHLVTCPGCKAAAAEQRHLKNAVAASAPPALSAGLLARLQGLPGGGDGGDFKGRDPFGGPDGSGDGDPEDGVVEATSLGGQRLSGHVFGGFGGFGSFGGFGRRREDFLAVPEPSPGFPIHEVERERPGTGNASRGRRFAFAAAGAFSMAALAISGAALPLEGVADGGVDDPGAAVTPLSPADVRGVRGTEVQGETLVGLVAGFTAAPTVLPSASTIPQATLVVGGAHATP
jgi:hypothetical protein